VESEIMAELCVVDMATNPIGVALQLDSSVNYQTANCTLQNMALDKVAELVEQELWDRATVEWYSA
jgi:hypothetical protein